MAGALKHLEVGAEHGVVQRGRGLADAAADLLYDLAVIVGGGVIKACLRCALTDGAVEGELFAGHQNQPVKLVGNQGDVVDAPHAAAAIGGLFTQKIAKQQLFERLGADFRLRIFDGNRDHCGGFCTLPELFRLLRIHVKTDDFGYDFIFVAIIIGVLRLNVNSLGERLEVRSGDRFAREAAVEYAVAAEQCGAHLLKQSVAVDAHLPAAFEHGQNLLFLVDLIGALGGFFLKELCALVRLFADVGLVEHDLPRGDVYRMGQTVEIGQQCVQIAALVAVGIGELCQLLGGITGAGIVVVQIKADAGGQIDRQRAAVCIVPALVAQFLRDLLTAQTAHGQIADAHVLKGSFACQQAMPGDDGSDGAADHEQQQCAQRHSKADFCGTAALFGAAFFLFLARRPFFSDGLRLRAAFVRQLRFDRRRRLGSFDRRGYPCLDGGKDFVFYFSRFVIHGLFLTDFLFI